MTDRYMEANMIQTDYSSDTNTDQNVNEADYLTESNPESYDLVSQPNVCRCCVSTTGTWDLTSSYMSARGEREVLLEMLQECYGIILSNITEWGASRFVCDKCVRSMRRGHRFKQQVLQAESTFLNYLRQKGGDHLDLAGIKTEDDVDQSSTVGGDFSGNDDKTLHDRCPIEIKNENDYETTVIVEHYTPEDTVIEEKVPESIEPKTSPEKTKTRKRVRKKYPKNVEEVKNVSDSENIDEVEQCYTENSTIEDVEPVSIKPETTSPEKPNHVKRIRNKCNESTETGKNIIENKKQKKSIIYRKMMGILTSSDTDEEESLRVVEDQQTIKQVSESKRVRITCETVLKDTDACPFRHHKSWFQCFYCPIDFMEINMLKHHIKLNHTPEDLTKIKRYPRTLQIEITDFQCNICNIDLIDVGNMVEHFATTHNKLVYKECIADYKVNKSPYTCHICDEQYHVFRNLTMHLNEHYANCICDVCGKSFLNSKRLKGHKRTHEIGAFPCTECGKILKTKASIANHMEAHSKRTIKCHICSKPMKHYNDRIKHMSEEHNITHKFKCSKCPREYKIKHYLATHVRQTHGYKNKKCIECGMAFITNHGLKKHMLKHTGVKAFVCSFCNKSFARSYTLKEHMRGHE